MKTRRYSNKVGGVLAGAGRQAAQFDIVSDSKGNLSRVRLQAGAPGGLLGRLLARSAAVVAHDVGSEPQPADVRQLAARTWHEVTDGAGVVLGADGEEVAP